MAAGETNLEISGGAGNTLPSSGRILVTGASRGIGRHIAVGLARPRRTLILVARTLDALEDVASECEDRGAKVCTIACQLENHDRLTHMLDIVKADGGADMVVNCAGIFGEEKLPWETDPDLWWQTQLVNVRAPYLIQHALVPGMLERGGGRILDLSSGAAIKDRDDSSGYYVSKTALMRLGGCLHEAGYARGLRVLEDGAGRGAHGYDTRLPHAQGSHRLDRSGRFGCYCCCLCRRRARRTLGLPGARGCRLAG